MPVHGIDWIDAVVWCNAYRELLEEINPSSSVPLPDESYPYHYEDVAIRDVSPSGVQLTSADIGFNSKAKTTFRLPTETEWEFAVRGGDPNSSAWRQEYAGSNKAVAVAWFEDNSENHAHEPGVETQGEGEGEAAKPEPMLPVKLAAPDKQGLYNMSGNVWEWCMTDDSLWDSVDTSTNWGNPNFDNKPLANLKRGGGYNDSATYCSNNTGRLKGPKDTDQDTGFRLVRTVSVVN
jgi:formylglycine-generating enzyme required for sulfatase activity